MLVLEAARDRSAGRRSPAAGDRSGSNTWPRQSADHLLHDLFGAERSAAAENGVRPKHRGGQRRGCSTCRTEAAHRDAFCFRESRSSQAAPRSGRDGAGRGTDIGRTRSPVQGIPVVAADADAVAVTTACTRRSWSDRRRLQRLLWPTLCWPPVRPKASCPSECHCSRCCSRSSIPCAWGQTRR